MSDDECPTCGQGSAFTDATFDDGDRMIRWTMWSCGHSARVLLGAELISVPAAGLQRQALLPSRA